jgi:hypothetical protein
MPNEPLDHYISQPPPDAVADVHGELDNLARVAVAAGDAMARTLAQRGAREAKALAAAATAEMGSAADDLAQARPVAGREADHATALAAMADDGYDLGQQGAGTTTPTLGDLLDASEAPGALSQGGTSDMVTDLGVDPAAEIPATLGDLLDASHPLSLHDELAAAQLSAGSAPTATAPPVEASLTTEVGLG